MPKPSRKKIVKSPVKQKRVGRASASSFKIVVRYRPHKKKTFDKGKGPPPKYIKLLAAKARRYKAGKRFTSAQSRAFNIRLSGEMAKAGFTPDAIREAKNYRMSSKVGIGAWSRVTSRVEAKSYKRAKAKRVKGEWVRGRDILKSVKIDGKWISAARFKAKIRMTKYNAQIKAYRERYGLNLDEARELYRGLRDENFGQKIFQALY